MNDPTDFRLRDAVPGDLVSVQAIYAHHVEHGLGSFEECAPNLSQVEQRFRTVTASGLPYLVAVSAGRVRGYAYASAYRKRSAYRFTLQDTVYVAPDYARRGAGAALLQALIAQTGELGYRRMVAVIGDSANLASIRLHEKAGFRMVGRLPSVGFKFGRWVDSVLLERPLGEGDESLP